MKENDIEENYEDATTGGEVDTALDDHSLFLKHVVGEDHDLLAIDNWLRNSFAAGSDE